jgi:transcriptional regulator with XRE-family HTH domain
MRTHMPAFTRTVLRCNHCQLVQFETSTGLCRRCHRPPSVTTQSPPFHPEQSPQYVSYPHTLQIVLGMRIRILRSANHLSQRALASCVGCPRTYVSKIERGRVLPSARSLQRFADALHTPIELLLCDERTFDATQQERQIQQDPFLAELAELLPMLTSTHKALLRTWLRDRVTPKLPLKAIA